MGNEKFIRCQESPYVGGMNCERILQAQSRIREAMHLFGMTAVCPSRIEHQVEIFQLRSASGEVTADHSDAAKADDAVVIAKSSGLDIAKRHRRRQVSPPHVPSSPSRGRQQHTATTKTPRRPGGAGGGEEEQANQGQASVSTSTLRSREKSQIPALLPAWARQLQCSPTRRSCSAQDHGSARARAVMVRPAGAVPSRRPATIRGERNASGSSSRMCRSRRCGVLTDVEWFPAAAIAAVEGLRVWADWALVVGWVRRADGGHATEPGDRGKTTCAAAGGVTRLALTDMPEPCGPCRSTRCGPISA